MGQYFSVAPSGCWLSVIVVHALNPAVADRLTIATSFTFTLHRGCSQQLCAAASYSGRSYALYFCRDSMHSTSCAVTLRFVTRMRIYARFRMVPPSFARMRPSLLSLMIISSKQAEIKMQTAVGSNCTTSRATSRRLTATEGNIAKRDHSMIFSSGGL